MGQRYNPQTQKWEEVADNNTPSSLSDPFTSSNRGKSNVNSSGKDIVIRTPNTPVSPSSNKDKSDGLAKEANKNFAEDELTYLTGDAEVEPNSVTFSTKAGDTVSLTGLGKYLSGLYFVTEVSIGITTSGLSLKYSVLKNGFGKSLKPYSEDNSSSDKVDVSSVTEFSIGDAVRFIDGVDAIYANASEGVTVPEWVRQQWHYISKLSDDGQKAYLRDINSWTYTKYLQK